MAKISNLYKKVLAFFFASTFLAYGVKPLWLYHFPVSSKTFGIALDPVENIYLSDWESNKITKYSTIGSVLGTYAETGTGNGQFNELMDIAIYNSKIYAADQKNFRVQTLNLDGTYSNQFGAFGQGDGQFNYPRGLAVDPGQGDIYVCDTDNSRIQILDLNGTYKGQWGHAGSGEAEFSFPERVLIANGLAYISDVRNHRVQIFSLEGEYFSQFGTNGTGDGQFQYVYGLGSDADNNIYVVDINNSRVQVFSSSNIFVTKFGSYGTGDGNFAYPRGLTLDSKGRVYVVDTGNSRISVFIDQDLIGKNGSITLPVLPLNSDVSLQSGASLLISNASNLPTGQINGDEDTLSVASGVTLTAKSGSSITAGSIVNNGTFNANLGSSTTIDTLDNHGTVNLSGTHTIDTILNKSGASLTATVAVCIPTLITQANSTSTFNAGISTTGSSTHAGTLYAVNGLTITNNSTFVTNTGSSLFVDSLMIDAGSTMDVGGALYVSRVLSSFPGSGNIILSSGTLIASITDSQSFSGVLSGTGGFTKAGTGTLSMSGANTYTGPTSISAGTLQTGAVNALPVSGDVDVSSGATLDLNDNNQSVGNITGVGNISLGS